MSSDLYKNGVLLLHGLVATADEFAGDGFSARAILFALAEHDHSQELTVKINSGGGDAIEAIAIYNTLKAQPCNVTVAVEGIAASAGSIIAMAGDSIIMHQGSLMMIHDPSGMTIGKRADHKKTADTLDKIAGQMASIYAQRSGRTIDQVRIDMEGELWLTDTEAVEAGYADQTDASKAAIVAAFDYRIYAQAPLQLVAIAKKEGWKAMTEKRILKNKKKPRKSSIKKITASLAKANEKIAGLEGQLTTLVEAAKTGPEAYQAARLAAADGLSASGLARPETPRPGQARKPMNWAGFNK